MTDHDHAKAIGDAAKLLGEAIIAARRDGLMTHVCMTPMSYEPACGFVGHEGVSSVEVIRSFNGYDDQ